MKTIDEIISAQEHCHADNCMECPYQWEPKDFDCITQLYEDTLQCLKDCRKSLNEKPLIYADIMMNRTYWFKTLIFPEVEYRVTHGKVLRKIDSGFSVLDDNGKGSIFAVKDMGKYWNAYETEPEI